VLKAGRILLFACLFLWTGVSAWAIANPENRCSRVAAGAIYNARYYDPELGRFTQPDTTISDISNPQSYNRYSYCLNDPLRYTDPDGRAPSDWANAWSGAMNRGATYVSAGPSHWIWNGTVGSINSLVGGLAEPLRFGSTAGALSGSGHATAGQIALGTLQEAGRAAAIVPVGAAIGKGTGTLITSLTAGGEEEVMGGLTSQTAQTLTKETLDATYPRVKLSKGTRQEIWDRSKAGDGKVYDPTGVEIKPGEPWQAGHKPGEKFTDAQQNAAQQNMDAETWKASQRDPDKYRPEKPRTNLSHQHENDH
jgi:RHS repeat-associated protein